MCVRVSMCHERVVMRPNAIWHLLLYFTGMVMWRRLHWSRLGCTWIKVSFRLSVLCEIGLRFPPILKRCFYPTLKHMQKNTSIFIHIHKYLAVICLPLSCKKEWLQHSIFMTKEASVVWCKNTFWLWGAAPGLPPCDQDPPQCRLTARDCTTVTKKKQTNNGTFEVELEQMKEQWIHRLNNGDTWKTRDKRMEQCEWQSVNFEGS